MSPIVTRTLQNQSLSPPSEVRSAPPRRLVRFAPEVVRELPDERRIRIDVNGCLAGTVLATPDASRELAAGWAFMHGFFESASELGRASVDGDRVSLMVEGGQDIDQRRFEAVGWSEPSSLAEPEIGERDTFQIDEARIGEILDEAWFAFRHDGGGDGYLHAGVASETGLKCIARDRTMDMAAAKILGWSLLNAQDGETTILIVRGMVGRCIVEAAARIGVSLIVTSAILTVEAFRAATGLSMTVIGMATSHSMGLLIDGGHIVEGVPQTKTKDSAATESSEPVEFRSS